MPRFRCVKHPIEELWFVRSWTKGSLIWVQFKESFTLRPMKSIWFKGSIMRTFTWIDGSAYFLLSLEKAIKDTTVSKNPTIFNIICWVAGFMGRSSHRPSPSIILLFHNFLQNSLQKSFQFIFLFFCNLTKIKIKGFEWSKSKQATHCFIFNLSK